MFTVYLDDVLQQSSIPLDAGMAMDMVDNLEPQYPNSAIIIRDEEGDIFWANNIARKAKH